MSDRMFADVPTTSDDAYEAARRSSVKDARQLRRLGAWLACHEFEAASAAAERRARVRMAQFETSAAEAW
jgi:hypothetical protein